MLERLNEMFNTVNLFIFGELLRNENTDLATYQMNTLETPTLAKALDKLSIGAELTPFDNSLFNRLDSEEDEISALDILVTLNLNLK